jgi:hypothetical protein
MLAHHGMAPALPAILEEAFVDSDSDDGNSSCSEADADDWDDLAASHIGYDYEGIMAALCGGHDADGRDAELDKRCRGGVTCDDSAGPACWQTTPVVKESESAAKEAESAASTGKRLLRGMLDAIPRILSRRSRPRMRRSNTY